MQLLKEHQLLLPATFLQENSYHGIEPKQHRSVFSCLGFGMAKSQRVGSTFELSQDSFTLGMLKASLVTCCLSPSMRN